jgi:formylglycine-generating enzyme required for sulfatase activity
MIKVLEPLDIKLTYNEAWLYCLTLSFDGRKNWRLPTQEEYDNYDTIKVHSCYEYGNDDYSKYMLRQVQAVCDVKFKVGPLSEEKMQYDEALMYCFMLEVDGERGWRLPTHDEYNDILGLSTQIWYYDEEHNVGEVWQVQPIKEI